MASKKKSIKLGSKSSLRKREFEKICIQLYQKLVKDSTGKILLDKKSTTFSDFRILFRINLILILIRVRALRNISVSG